MKKLLLSLLALSSLIMNAQETEKKITVKTYGFVGFDAFVDSRLSVTARNNHVYLYPKSESLDNNGKDKNARSSYDFGVGISRLGFNITGPNAFGATTLAKIEGDFVGSPGKDGNDYLLRLRHAFLMLKWEKTSLLAGQSWHPFFVTENYPATVNFVCGAPIHPISRAPQLKYTYSPSSDFSVALIALSQGDFQNKGGAVQVEMADMPELNMQLKYGSPKKFFVAATFGVKNQQPVSLDSIGNISKNKVTSIQSNLSVRYTTPYVTFKAEGIYGGNMTNMVMLGGLAEKATSTADNPQYTPIMVSSFWTDIHTNGKNVQFGIFAGQTSNLGTNEKSSVTNVDFTRSASIGYVYAFAPRIIWTSGKVKIGLELMHTAAGYGTGYNQKAKPTDTNKYTNNRITLGLRYNF